ncbi:LuxR C-terminal-related transcriptional regulator [Streptomyces sp. NPDC056661]|uniref:LuxR C-terminal-related transcriptional regulator n=1 Tax=Streptomyces sp. NPDC056661 TaxID=3345898 RepID=UPI0036C6C4D7
MTPKISTLTGHAVMALCFMAAGDLDDGITHADTAGQAIDIMNDTELTDRLEAVAWTVAADIYGGRYLTSARRAARGVALARASGRTHLLLHLLVRHGSALRMTGRLNEARTCLEEACNMGQGAAGEHLTVTAHIELARVTLLQGEVLRALQLAEAAVKLAGEFSRSAVEARTMLGHARFAANDVPGCLEHVTAAGGGADLPLIERLSRPAEYELLTRAALAEADTALAQQWAGQALAAVDHSSHPTATAYAALADSHTLLALGDTGASVSRALAAVDGFKRASNRVELGRARMALGKARAADGHRKEAADELRAAVDDFSHCGAPRLEDEATRELRRLGVKVARAAGRGLPAGGVVSLSRRELEVAEHVARGLTNREVAAWMYLSEKTVERHLSSIFMKLGVRSRVALALELRPSA